jgi:hypothetical protein
MGFPEIAQTPSNRSVNRLFYLFVFIHWHELVDVAFEADRREPREGDQNFLDPQV